VKYLLPVIAILLSASLTFCQDHFNIIRIHLPDEVKYHDNQFSGLQIANGRLYLMSESRLQDKQEARLYSVDLAQLERYKKDTTYTLHFRKHRIAGLDSLSTKMKLQGQVYEGLEAMYIQGNSIYFSVETNTPSPLCYLLKGHFVQDDVYLSRDIIPVPKPRKSNGTSIYNAGFEAITVINNRLFTFYEYNYFDNKNEVYSYDTSLKRPERINYNIQKLPFRITDITPVGKNHYTAINYFYKGDGDDAVYRVPETDKKNDELIRDSGQYHNYCRLIDIYYNGRKFTWKPLWQFPALYMGYNWEGIAADSKGYYIINDKYTPARPYASVLLYLERKK